VAAIASDDRHLSAAQPGSDPAGGTTATATVAHGGSGPTPAAQTAAAAPANAPSDTALSQTPALASAQDQGATATIPALTEQAASLSADNAAAVQATALPPASGTTTLAPQATPTTQATQVAPAAQVAPSLVSLAQIQGGTQRLTLHLDPASLGHVEVQIDRPQDAPPQVLITVQRQQTLDLLQRDQPQLQHALDQAGVPKEGRTLTLHLAQPDTGAAAFGNQTGNWGNQNFGGNPNGNRSGNGVSRSDGDSNRIPGADAETTQPPPSRFARGGLDITA
jgi:flagellar hook-length control protein FliK